MYKVIKYFEDLQDNLHPYNIGEEYPRKGLKVSKERITELAGNKNLQGVPLIEKIEEKQKKLLKKCSQLKKLQIQSPLKKKLLKNLQRKAEPQRNKGA